MTEVEQPPRRPMTLISIKKDYSSNHFHVTLVDNERDRVSITKLLELSGAKVVVTAVPIWPEMATEE